MADKCGPSGDDSACVHVTDLHCVYSFDHHLPW